MKTYKVIVVGLGKRGRQHAAMFRANPRFELAGICTRDHDKLERTAAELGNPRASTDPHALAKEVRPDVFSICTPPFVRLELIQMGVASGARLVEFEKPVALSMNEALAIREATRNVKTVVCHQLRYARHYQAVKGILSRLGRIHTVYGTGVGWMMHLFTHLVDYMRWFNGEAEAEWVMAQAAGRSKLGDNHPSPDYISATIQFANGVRGLVECGAGAPDVPEVEAWWRKCRVGAQGTEGFAEALTGGGWRAVTREGLQTGEGKMDYDLDMPPYVSDIATWLDDDAKIHPCNGSSAHRGFEIAMAALRSVIGRGQVRLPLGRGEPELEALSRVLPDLPVQASCERNQKEFV